VKLGSSLDTQWDNLKLNDVSVHYKTVQHLFNVVKESNKPMFEAYIGIFERCTELLRFLLVCNAIGKLT
jgi:hypothetical protein